MALIDDGRSVYTLDRDGEKRFATSRNVSINGEPLFRFDPDTGILEFSADDACIEKLVESVGGYPIAGLVLELGILGEHHFHNVSEIKLLPRKDGSFFIGVS